MPEDGATQSATLWPVPKFRFKVEWDTATLSFQEVSGLDVEAQPIEYRHGDAKKASVLKMPGLLKYTDVTMKKGVFKSDLKFWEWFTQVKSNTIKRLPVTISLLDEGEGVVMVWKLENAWPTKVTGTDLKSQTNEAAIETIVIAHEGLTVSLS